MGKAKRKSDWFDWVKALLIAFALAFIVRTFFFTPIIVDGPSMMPTLHNRDQMIVNKFDYRIHEPNRFDIIVFHASNKKDFIKRVIGLPGEHVAVRDNVLYINGEAVEEPFLEEQKQKMKPYQILTEDFSLENLPGEYEAIPKDHVLVLGDNRGNSVDSRDLGLISMEQIVGKTSVIYWPFKRMQVLGEGE
ncbi:MULTISPECIES: signal peptidase I [unclassified Virgibacillus]|uniref:signal peptidase I n=1 Tax=unclassified Virgibacillus TaxID=2620237 RepID=UPI0024DEFF74|nr:signal peptidase I [Virgibacillus sp. LDC-1]